MDEYYEDGKWICGGCFKEFTDEAPANECCR